MVVVNVGPDQYDIYVECGEKRLEEWSLKSQGDQQECWVASEEGKVRGSLVRDADSVDRIPSSVGISSRCEFSPACRARGSFSAFLRRRAGPPDSHRSWATLFVPAGTRSYI